MSQMGKNISVEQIYQYADGTYLPDSSQPDPQSDFEIVSDLYMPHKSTRYINVLVEVEERARLKNEGNLLLNDNKELPELYTDRENCCGCAACFASCPNDAISMRPDEEGFLYPVVDAQKCIRCYNCISVCNFKEEQRKKGLYVKK